MMPEMDGFALAAHVRQEPDLAGAAIMMLTSDCHQADTGRCRKLGLEAYLVKPVKNSDLLRAIQATLGTARAGPASRAGQNGGVRLAASAPHGNGHARLHILLAEDNLVNQRVALRLLENQGHTVVLARNGKEALAVLERQAVDLVLMDVQMPVMDGIEAAALIRRREQGTGRHLPMIALTAHAMKGDRERCLEAGMDDYLSKPIHAEDLQRAIAGLDLPAASEASASGGRQPPVGCGKQGADAPRSPTFSRDEPVFDRQALLARLGGDLQALDEVVNLFLVEAPAMQAALRAALDQGKVRELEHAAHSLKGSLTSLAAPEAAAAARRLEDGARAGELAGAAELVVDLEEKMERLQILLGQEAHA